MFDQSNALCEVLTFKEGLLSAFGHDLRIVATSFFIKMQNSPPGIKAVFDSGSLLVDCAMEKDTPRPGLLTDKDRLDINRNTRKDVLEANRYEAIIFVSSGVRKKETAYEIEGELSLHGHTAGISLAASRDEGYYVSETWLHLPDFGIKPFSTAWGTIRIKPDVLVRVKIPISELEGFL